MASVFLPNFFFSTNGGKFWTRLSQIFGRAFSTSQIYKGANTCQIVYENDIFQWGNDLHIKNYIYKKMCFSGVG